MKKHSVDLTTGSVGRKLLLYSLPLMINYAINVFYGVADKAMLGRYVGTDAMAAAGVTNSPYNLVYNLFVGIALGVLVCCGNFIGARDQERLRKCMHTGLLTGFLLGVLILFVGMPLSRPFLEIMGAPKKLIKDALLYFRIRFLACPITMLNAFAANIMNAHGDTKRNTAFGICSGFLNVVLNYVFLLVIKLGVAGVALATLLSAAANLTCKLVVLFSPKGEYRLRLRELRLHGPLVKRILAIGIPNGLNTTVFSLSNVLLQSTVNAFGTTVIAGNSAADSVAGIVSIGYNGIPSATIAAISQCRGARNNRRIGQIMKKALLMCHLTVDTACIISLLFARQMLGIFTDSAAVVDAGIFKLWFYCGGYFIHNFGQIYVAGIKGLGKSTMSFLANVGSICLPRIAWVLFVVPLMSTPAMLYMIYPISWLISSVALGLTYRSCYRNLVNKAQPVENLQTS